MLDKITSFIKELYGNIEFIPLHEPRFIGNEKRFISECIDSTFVSSIGQFVSRFELMVAEYVGTKYAVATVNGTSALHAALVVAGVKCDDEVITQPLTFVATANAITYAGAKPIFIDSDKRTFGMCHESLQCFLETKTFQKDDGCYNRASGRKITACVPVHIFGHPMKINLLKEICDRYNIILIEDAAESLGSFYNGKHTGTFGTFGVLSFNGNKIITTGGGGMIITDNEDLAKKVKHITTTANIRHKWAPISHDEIGYNYRMPNLNAALGCAQMEKLQYFIEEKRAVAELYNNFFRKIGINFFTEPEGAKSNYWLNTIIFNDITERDLFLEHSNSNGVMTRPIWTLMNKLEMYKECQSTSLENSIWIEERAVNIPSSVRI